MPIHPKNLQYSEKGHALICNKYLLNCVGCTLVVAKVGANNVLHFEANFAAKIRANFGPTSHELWKETWSNFICLEQLCTKFEATHIKFKATLSELRKDTWSNFV